MPTAAKPNRAILYLLVFVAGFTVMAIEMTAPRLLGPFFGTSVAVWTNVIGVILAALSIGYYVGGRIADRTPDPALLAVLVMVGCAISALSPMLVPWIGRSVMPEGVGLGQAYGVIKWGSLATAFVAFFPPAIVLAMVGPFTIRTIAEHDAVGRSAGTVYALGTIGSLLGTFLPTFWLVPLLGSRMTILVAAGALFAVALIVFVVHRRGIPKTTAAILVFVAAGIMQASPLRGGDDLVEELESPYQYVRVGREARDAGGDVLLLQVNEPVTDYQSMWVEGQTLTGSYYDHFGLLPSLLRQAPDDGKLDVLILGLAGGAISRQYHDFFAATGGRKDTPALPLAIDGVEVDPGVVALARRHFGLDEKTQPHLRVHVVDGRVFLRTSGTRYDVIIVDAYAHQIYLPPHMTTVGFFEEVGARLAPGGVVALNVSAYRIDAGLVPRLVNTVARAFGEAFLAPTIPANYLVFAFEGGGAPTDTPWPPRPTIPVPPLIEPLWSRLVAPRNALRFRDRAEAPVFTDDDCPVEVLANLDLAREAASK